MMSWKSLEESTLGDYTVTATDRKFKPQGAVVLKKWEKKYIIKQTQRQSIP